MSHNEEQISSHKKEIQRLTKELARIEEIKNKRDVDI